MMIEAAFSCFVGWRTVRRLLRSGSRLRRKFWQKPSEQQRSVSLLAFLNSNHVSHFVQHLQRSSRSSQHHQWLNTTWCWCVRRNRCWLTEQVQHREMATLLIWSQLRWWWWWWGWCVYWGTWHKLQHHNTQSQKTIFKHTQANWVTNVINYQEVEIWTIY